MLKQPTVVFFDRKESRKGRIFATVVIEKVPYFILVCEDGTFTSRPVERCRLDAMELEIEQTPFAS